MELNKKRGEIGRDFAQSTSCHGLAQIYDSRNKVQKAFWALLTFTVLVILVYQLSIRIREYQEHKTTTSISETFANELDFPAVTICNFNNYFGIKSPEERGAIHELAGAKSSYFNENEIDFNKTKYFDDFYDGSIRNYSTEKGWEINNETLVWCYTSDGECISANFTYRITELGKCWTIKNPYKIIRAGSRHGLSMVFNVQHAQYSEDPQFGNWEAGLKVQVHPWYDEPEVDQLGMAIPIGNMAFISLHKVEHQIMKKPWGDCDPNSENLKYHTKYSRPNCFQECSQDLLDRLCECRMYLFNESTTLRECNTTETLNCLANVNSFARLYLTADNCNCQPPCSSERYDTSISYATIPNEAVNDKIMKTVNIEGIDLRETIVGVTIFYKKMSYTKQEESKAITESALTSDLGGQLGLWIGISVVTIFEFVQFIAMYCIESGSSIKQRNQQRSERDNQEPEL